MNPETKTMPPHSSAADEVAWLRALRALELCQQAAERAARIHLSGPAGPSGAGGPDEAAWPSAVPLSAASIAG